MCNIGNLLLALGLFFEEPILIRVAVIWTVPGVAVWFVYVVPTWEVLLTGRFTYTELFGVLSSTLAHLGGFAVGIVVLRRVRNGWTGVALCLHLVFRRATTLATCDTSSNERKPLAQNPAGMGTNLQQLLELLVRVDRSGRCLPLHSGIITQAAMARCARADGS